MKRKHLLLLLIVCNFFFVRADVISVIPRPVSLEQGKGNFTFAKTLKVSVPDYPGDSLERVFTLFEQPFRKATGIKVAFTRKARKAHLLLNVDKSLAPEAYRLDVSEKQILVEASRPAGFFYALQTLKQLMPRNVMAGVPDPDIRKWSLPVIRIEDEPRFGWRGFMLDEGRHFFGVDAVKKVIDILATYKMNRFHWHLTEDQGWRIEIKSAPKLTEVGAWRNSKVLGWGDVKCDGQHYGGFYTQEQAREIVAYAKERFIEIVPEIDIPGHSQAAVASYPEWLACDPENKHEVWLTQGISTDVINVAKPEARQFARNVIDELIEIFPFQYIHLGGDECPTHKWERNAECQALLQSIGSKNYRDLQLHFYEELQDYIAGKPADKQRKLIFWNEVLHGNTKGLGNDFTVMAWVGADRAAKEAAAKGMNTILSPQSPYYLNRRQAKGKDEPATQGSGTETVEAVYNYVPMKNVPENLQEKYMGVQANFWTEWVLDASTLQYLMLPRIAAVAEAGWTPQDKRSYQDFIRRLQADKILYQLNGWSFGPHVFK